MSEGGWTAAARWRRPPAGGLIVIVIFSNACGAHLLAEGAADDEALAHPQGEVQGGALVRCVRHRIPDLVQPPGLQRYPDGLLQLPVLEAPAPAPSSPHRLAGPQGHWRGGSPGTGASVDSASAPAHFCSRRGGELHASR